MGLGGSKCCKDLCSTEEVKKPLVDPETGRVPRAGTGGGGRDDEGRWGDRGRRASEPVEPDPAVFYSRPPRSRSQRRLANNDTARETASDRREARAREHHHRSNQKVGEETVLRFHQENPAKAPIVGSSSEDDIGAKPASAARTDDVSPARSVEKDEEEKNWIGVCDAKLQHRVWWWSITFVLFFVVGMGVFLGLAHGYRPEREDHPTSPLYPRVAVLDDEPNVAERSSHRKGGHASSEETIHATKPTPVRISSTQMLREWEAMDESLWSERDQRGGRRADAVKGTAGSSKTSAMKVRERAGLAHSRKMTPGGRLGPGGRKSGGAKRGVAPPGELEPIDSPLEDPRLRADLNAAVSRLLRKEIESVGTDAPSSTH